MKTTLAAIQRYAIVLFKKSHMVKMSVKILSDLNEICITQYKIEFPYLQSSWDFWSHAGYF